MHLRLGAVIIAVLLSGCVVGPDYERPEIETPEEFRQRISTGAAITNIPWWQLFEDPQLERLILIALEENRDLAIATARIEETRARLGFVRADQYPRIDGEVGANRGNTSRAVFAGRWCAEFLHGECTVFLRSRSVRPPSTFDRSSTGGIAGQ